MNDSTQRRSALLAAVPAAALTCHAIFVECLRSHRGDYWSGWSTSEVWGALLAAMVYGSYLFLFLFVPIVGMRRIRPAFAASRAFLAALLLGASIVLWGTLFSQWDGARGVVAAVIAGTLLAIILAMVCKPLSATWMIAPSLAGIVAVEIVARATLLDPSARRHGVPGAVAYFVGVWLVLAVLWWWTRGRMRRRYISPIVGALLCVLPIVAYWVTTRAPSLPSDTRPNLVLISVDSLRADYCSVYGGETPTPALAALAQHGRRFNRAYALATWTLPSMEGLFTSSYPPSLTPGRDHDAWVDEMRHYTVAPDQPLLAETLRESGYATYALLGNKLLDQPDGILRGFDGYAVFHSAVTARRSPLGQTLFLEDLVARVLPSCFPLRSVDTTRSLTDLGEAFLHSVGSRPFFLWIHYMDPHAPWDPPFDMRDMDGPWTVVDPSDPQWGGPQFEPDTHKLPLQPDEKAYVRSLYEGEIRYIDTAIGRLVDVLRAQGINQRTYVCVTADHGEEFWDHGLVTHGQSLYEELVRIPLLVTGPGVTPGEEGAPVSHLDLMPTLATLLGLTPSPTWRGRALTTADGNIATANASPVFAQSTYIVAPEPLRMTVDNSLKAIEGLEDHTVNLFNLDDDPKELHRLDDPEEMERFRTRMIEWWKTFPATIEERIKAGGDAADDMLEKLRALGYMD